MNQKKSMGQWEAVQKKLKSRTETREFLQDKLEILLEKNIKIKHRENI